MSKILASSAALALLIVLALPGPTSAAERRADGVRADDSAMTDVSAYRRYWRGGVYRRAYWGGRPYWRARYGAWGPRYGYWRPRYAYWGGGYPYYGGYYPYYRPYWRPWGWGPRPFVSVGFGFGPRWWW
jgi:hypothetical protein